jgi:hypothetical protein
MYTLDCCTIAFRSVAHCTRFYFNSSATKRSGRGDVGGRERESVWCIFRFWNNQIRLLISSTPIRPVRDGGKGGLASSSSGSLLAQRVFLPHFSLPQTHGEGGAKIRPSFKCLDHTPRFHGSPPPPIPFRSKSGGSLRRPHVDNRRREGRAVVRCIASDRVIKLLPSRTT